MGDRGKPQPCRLEIIDLVLRLQSVVRPYGVLPLTGLELLGPPPVPSAHQPPDVPPPLGRGRIEHRLIPPTIDRLLPDRLPLGPELPARLPQLSVAVALPMLQVSREVPACPLEVQRAIQGGLRGRQVAGIPAEPFRVPGAFRVGPPCAVPVVPLEVLTGALPWVDRQVPGDPPAAAGT